MFQGSNLAMSYLRKAGYMLGYSYNQDTALCCAKTLMNAGVCMPGTKMKCECGNIICCDYADGYDPFSEQTKVLAENLARPNCIIYMIFFMEKEFPPNEIGARLAELGLSDTFTLNESMDGMTVFMCFPIEWLELESLKMFHDEVGYIPVVGSLKKEFWGKVPTMNDLKNSKILPKMLNNKAKASFK